MIWSIYCLRYSFFRCLKIWSSAKTRNSMAMLVRFPSASLEFPVIIAQDCHSSCQSQSMQDWPLNVQRNHKSQCRWSSDKDLVVWLIAVCSFILDRSERNSDMLWHLWAVSPVQCWVEDRRCNTCIHTGRVWASQPHFRCTLGPSSWTNM